MIAANMLVLRIVVGGTVGKLPSASGEKSRLERNLRRVAPRHRVTPIQPPEAFLTLVTNHQAR